MALESWWATERLAIYSFDGDKMGSSFHESTCLIFGPKKSYTVVLVLALHHQPVEVE